MNSLAGKLTLAFLIVSLAGNAFVALLASRITAVAFGNFIDSQNQTLIADQLADYYEVNNGWDGARLPNPRFIGERGTTFGSGQGQGPNRFPITVVDADGVVVVPGNGRRPGDRIPENVLQAGFPIEVEGETVGYLIEWSNLERQQFRDAFNRRVNQTILLAALGAVGLSLLLGGVLSRSLTRPLQELTNATEKMGEGELGQQVPVRTKDELGKLAISFNQMSYQLAQAQSLRRQMTADIAHDLRTPLSLILGHAEALRDGVLPPDQQTFDIMYDEARRLNRLVEDLRLLSLAEAGELALSMQLVSADSLMRRAHTAHLNQAKDKQITLDLTLPLDLPEVEVDPDRIAQVLDNLVSNAIRYTPENGRVHLSVQSNAQTIQLIVQDSGPGLTEEELAHVFDRFYRGDKARARQVDGGTGLGLAIAKSLVLAHNGRIWAESKPSAGATFIVELPVTTHHH